MIVAGIDPSLTSAGIAVLRDGRPVLLTSVGHTGRDGASFAHRSRRIVSQVRAVMGALDNAIYKQGLMPEYALAVIEEPAWRLNMPSAHDRAGLWWGIYSALTAKNIPIAVMNPKTRAKWATGRGNAEKREVLDAVQETWAQWKPHIRNDDIADALTMAEAGARWLGEPLPFEPRRRHIEGLEVVTWPEGVKA